MKIRTGRRNGRTLYLQLTDEPRDDDPCIGFAVDPEVAAEIGLLSTGSKAYQEDALDTIRRIVT